MNGTLGGRGERMSAEGKRGALSGIGAILGGLGGLGGLATLLAFLCSGKSPPCWCPTASTGGCGGAGGAGGGVGGVGGVGGAGGGSGSGPQWTVQVATNTNVRNAEGSLEIVRRDIGEEGIVFRKADAAFVTVVGKFESQDKARNRAEEVLARGWKYGAVVRNLVVLCPQSRPAEVDQDGYHLKYFDCR